MILFLSGPHLGTLWIILHRFLSNSECTDYSCSRPSAICSRRQFLFWAMSSADAGDPKKIEDVKCWPVPDCLKSVRQFLGFVGYYRRFIPRFADIVEPLVALTGKDVPFVWRPECAAAFLLLRDALVRAPILAFPTESGDYVLDTDASNFGLGGVLSQIQNDQERVIAYCSRALRPSLRKYCTTKREMLAAVSMCTRRSVHHSDGSQVSCLAPPV